MRSQRKRDLVYNTLFDRIVTGHCPAGTRLREERLASEFKLSRTPVRDILNLLAQDGLVRRKPHCGVQVAGFTADDVEEVYDIRKALELLAVDCAVARIHLQRLRDLRARVAALAGVSDVARHVELDQAIHGCIVEACRRPRLTAVLNQQLRLMRHFRYMGFKDVGVIGRTTQEHGALLDALLARRADEARTAMAAHLEEAKRQVLSSLCAPREAVKARNPARTRGLVSKRRKPKP
jgi:DNA-binding GntR family transcriptional regulator